MLSLIFLKILPVSRDLEQAAEHLAAHALYMIEAEHQTQVVYNAEMVQELFH